MHFNKKYSGKTSQEMAEAKTIFRSFKFQPKCCGSRQVFISIQLWPYKILLETQTENLHYVPKIQSLHNMTTLWCMKQAAYIIAVQRTPLTKKH